MHNDVLLKIVNFHPPLRHNSDRPSTPAREGLALLKEFGWRSAMVIGPSQALALFLRTTV